jgi:hypothetical protein
MTDIPAKVYVPLMIVVLGVTMYVAGNIIPLSTATVSTAANAPRSQVDIEREYYRWVAKLEACTDKGIKEINNADMVPSERKAAYVENVNKCYASMPPRSPEAVAFGKQPVK